MGKINSRAKGARGEREFAAYLRERGIEARRGQQFAGGHDSPDVVADLPGIHFEVKRTEALNVYAAMEQAKRDGSGMFVIPVVAHRRNEQEWLGIVPMGLLIPLLRKYSEDVYRGVKTL